MPAAAWLPHQPVSKGRGFSRAVTRCSCNAALTAKGKLMPATLVLFLLALAAASPPPASGDRQALLQSMERKLAWVEQNGARQFPDRRPTEFSEAEVNAWLAAGRVKLPRGVEKVRLSGRAGRIVATAQVDFDALKQGRDSSNPLLALFSGVHQARVQATASGADGLATLHTESAELDGIPVPLLALSFFLDRYLRPRYPQAAVDTTFALPARVHTATIREHVLVVTQK